MEYLFMVLPIYINPTTYLSYSLPVPQPQHTALGRPECVVDLFSVWHTDRGQQVLGSGRLCQHPFCPHLALSGCD